MALRVLRLLRVTWAARYVQALRPLLRSRGCCCSWCVASTGWPRASRSC
jgi:hypothetical protein